MKRYDSYKDSGVEWLGEIPSHWRKSKFKFVSDLYTGNSLNDSQKLQYESENLDDIPYISSKDIDVEFQTVNYNNGLRIPRDNNPLKISPKGSFLMVIEGGSSGRKKVYLEQDVCFVNKLCSFNSRENNKFQYYFIQSSNYQDKFKLSMSGLIGGVSISNLKDFELTLPPLSEQQQIVSFLDTKTSLIDSLIEKIQRKIELLKEKRTSLINEVVTKGLNPNVEMKDSGVEWIGEIPSGWNLKQLKHIIKTLNSGTSVNSEDTPVTNLDEYGVLKTSCVFGDTFRPNENKKVVIEEYDRVKCPVLKDSIIFSRMNTPDLVGSNGYVDTNYDNLFLPDRLWITDFFEDIKLSVKWLSFVTISRRFRSELSSRSTGTSPSMKNITKDDLLTIKIPYPSFLEQQQIVEYLDEQTQLIDNTISVGEKRIELLKEYRQSIISEVVTGKLKVTTDE